MITYPSGDQRLPGKGFYEIRGLAWSGGGAIKQVEVSTDGGKKWNKAQFQGTPQRMAHCLFTYGWNWDGNETEIMSRCVDEIGQAQPTREQIAKHWNKPFDQTFSVTGLDNSRAAVEDRQGRERDQWLRVGRSPIAFALLLGVPALAQGPTYGIGRTPTPEEIRARDISIGPTGDELPAGKGSAKEGAVAYRTKGCAGCHGATGVGGYGTDSEKQRRPPILTSGRAAESCRCARLSRRRCGTTSTAACRSTARAR